MSQLPQAGLEEPIHTPSPWKMSRTQPVPRCLHGLCSARIQHWDRQNAMCPLCRQLFQLLLCSVPPSSHSKEYLVPHTTTATAAGPGGSPMPSWKLHWHRASAETCGQLGVLLALALNKYSDAFQEWGFFCCL